MEGVEVKTDDGLALEGWFFPPPEDSAKPVLVYFHGNAGSIQNRGPVVRPWMEDGYGVLLVEYRGYGGNPGSPSEEGLYEDARAWLGWLAGHGIADGRVIVYGESLGSGVAVQMAMEHPGLLAVVLQSAYTSLPDVARLSYPYVPVNLLMKDRFETLDKIGSLNVPVLLLHGARDPLIPVAQANALYEAAVEPKRIVVFPEGRHNDLSAEDRKAGLDLFLTSLPRDEEQEEGSQNP
ncbi:MAG TPA: alpha/beta fold hydrolase, partial [Alphaproteobacteria bacterium]|nr:alpha/beta fold hydrolase [Alphaproteobacteria bacterium]